MVIFELGAQTLHDIAKLKRYNSFKALKLDVKQVDENSSHVQSNTFKPNDTFF